MLANGNDDDEDDAWISPLTDAFIVGHEDDEHGGEGQVTLGDREAERCWEHARGDPLDGPFAHLPSTDLHARKLSVYERTWLAMQIVECRQTVTQLARRFHLKNDTLRMYKRQYESGHQFRPVEGRPPGSKDAAVRRAKGEARGPAPPKKSLLEEQGDEGRESDENFAEQTAESDAVDPVSASVKRMKASVASVAHLAAPDAAPVASPHQHPYTHPYACTLPPRSPNPVTLRAGIPSSSSSSAVDPVVAALAAAAVARNPPPHATGNFSGTAAGNPARIAVGFVGSAGQGPAGRAVPANADLP